MALFQVGDRVRVTSGNVSGFCDSSRGLIGTVEEVDDTYLPVLVYFDNGESDWGRHEELQSIIEAPVESGTMTQIKEQLEAQLNCHKEQSTKIAAALAALK